MLLCVYHSHKFVLSAYLTIQAILEIEKRRVDSSCATSHTSVISILLPFGQFSLLLLHVWIIAMDLILFFLPLNLPPPQFQNTHSYSSDKLPADYVFMLFPFTFLEYLSFSFSCFFFFFVLFFGFFFWFLFVFYFYFLPPGLYLALFLKHTLYILSGYVCIQFSKSK